eukprot:3302962-Rhodomonas_salina.2
MIYCRIPCTAPVGIRAGREFVDTGRRVPPAQPELFSHQPVSSKQRHRSENLRSMLTGSSMGTNGQSN